MQKKICFSFILTLLLLAIGGAALVANLLGYFVEARAPRMHVWAIIAIVSSFMVIVVALIISYVGRFFIRELQRSHDALKRHAGFLESLLDAIPNPIFYVGIDGRYRLCNRSFEEFTGTSRKSLVGMTIHDLHPRDIADSFTQRNLAMLQDGVGAIQRYEHEAVDNNGEVRYIFINKALMIDDRNEMGIIGVFVDITDRKRMENALRESEDRFRSVLDNSLDIVYRRNLREDRYDYLSPALAQITGFSAADCLDSPMDLLFSRVHPEDVEPVRMKIDGMLAGDESTDAHLLEYRLLDKNGNYHWIADRVTVVRDDRGVPLYLTGVLRDITERKEYERRLQEALDEKETLLRELYHRTKNNMQIISGLINLQVREIDDEPAKAALAETRNRIMAMALVHRQLYRSQNLSRIDLAEYLRSLAGNILLTCGIPESRVSLSFSLETVTISIDQAIPCGLVVNELLTNSVKHAFPGGRCGVIAIGLSRDDENVIHVRYADDGVGVPEGFDFRNAKTLGCTLIFSIIENQFGGTLAFSSMNGVACSISFPGKNVGERI